MVFEKGYIKEKIRIARVKIQREPGALYYVKADEQGWLCIYKCELKRGGKKKMKEKKLIEKDFSLNKEIELNKEIKLNEEQLGESFGEQFGEKQEPEI